MNIFGAWRLAALGSGDALRHTGDLSVQWSTRHGDRGLLRRTAGAPIPYVGGTQRLAVLHSGGVGGAILRQVYFFDLF